jgi:hypothetical protein
MAASGNVANTSTSSLKKTNILIISRRGHKWEGEQRTGYNAYNDNKYYTRRDRKNGPEYQDERRDGTKQNHKLRKSFKYSYVVCGEKA